MMKKRREEKAEGRSKEKCCEANYIAYLNCSMMTTYFPVDIDWKNCKKGCTEEVGVDVHNLIVDVLQAVQRLPK
jgi:hypothetical protein